MAVIARFLGRCGSCAICHDLCDGFVLFRLIIHTAFVNTTYFALPKQSFRAKSDILYIHHELATPVVLFPSPTLNAPNKYTYPTSTSVPKYSTLKSISPNRIDRRHEIEANQHQGPFQHETRRHPYAQVGRADVEIDRPGAAFVAAFGVGCQGRQSVQGRCEDLFAVDVSALVTVLDTKHSIFQIDECARVVERKVVLPVAGGWFDTFGTVWL